MRPSRLYSPALAHLVAHRSVPRVLALATLVILGAVVVLPAPKARSTPTGGESIAYSFWFFAVPDTWLAGGGLCMVGADGGAPQRLTGPEFDISPTWSPDGTRLAFSSAATRAQPHGYDVYTLVLRSDAIRGVTTTDDWNEFNLDPAWSPDGRRLALAVGYHTSSVIVYDLASRRRWNVGEDQFTSSPTWSPDGRRVAYAGGNPLGTAIYEADSDGRSVRRLVENASQPDYSPDGSQLAYVDSRGDVVVANADGSDQEPLAVTPEVESDPDWSPDGTRIAFARKLQSGSAIVVSRVDGSAEKTLVRSSFELSGPAWRPGGGMQTSRQRCIRRGRSGAERLLGTVREDVILGRAGDDRINGGSGRDLLNGGLGADRISGGSGDDVVIGGSGSDHLYGDDGRDTIWARDGILDRIECGRGRDDLYADFRDVWTEDCEAVNRHAPAAGVGLHGRRSAHMSGDSSAREHGGCRHLRWAWPT